MPYHKQGSYDGFDSVEEVKEHYKRVRTRKHFIFSDKAVENHSFTCVCCKKLITVKLGNRCEYLPKSKKIAIMHYLCAWENIMDHIYLGKALV